MPETARAKSCGWTGCRSSPPDSNNAKKDRGIGILPMILLEHRLEADATFLNSLIIEPFHLNQKNPRKNRVGMPARRLKMPP